MSPERHWSALDHTFSQLLPAPAVQRGHARLAQRAAALSDIYLRVMAKTGRGDFTRELTKLHRVHQRLAAAVRER